MTTGRALREDCRIVEAAVWVGFDEYWLAEVVGGIGVADFLCGS